MSAQMQRDVSSARILLVDDEEINVRLLRRILSSGGYETIRSTSDGREVTSIFADFEPDILLLDLHMTPRNGFDVLRELGSVTKTNGTVPVLMLTADTSSESRRGALSLGAKDFLSKPFDTLEVLLRIRNLLETRFLYCSLESHNHALEERVAGRTRDLEQSQLEILERLTRTAEIRDDDTGHHTARVGELSCRLAEAAGLPACIVALLRRAAPLHDLGKVGVPDSILRKPGKLTPEEMALMKTHTTIGATLLAGGHSDVILMAERIALAHHEWWNGEGYPTGSTGFDIPIEARVVAIADCFDALSHDRPYRKAWPLPDVMKEMKQHRGCHFDPTLIDAFIDGECYRRAAPTPVSLQHRFVD